MSTPSYYEAIAAHYDAIFPLSPITLDFLAAQAGRAHAVVADIACGNAAYSLALAERGFRVTAVDLDVGMLAAAREKIADADVAERLLLLEGDMCALDEMELEPADLLFCIGNSLVHLPDTKSMGVFFEGARSVVKPGGRVVLQVINYDRVIGKGLAGLPTLSNEAASLTFERLYEPMDMKRDPSGDIHAVTPVGKTGVSGLKPGSTFTFHTRLTVKGKTWESRIPLYPLLSEELTVLLAGAGFSDVRLYGDFRQSPYVTDESYALIAVATA